MPAALMMKSVPSNVPAVIVPRITALLNCADPSFAICQPAAPDAKLGDCNEVTTRLPLPPATEC
jgi:hypothetical protein